MKNELLLLVICTANPAPIMWRQNKLLLNIIKIAFTVSLQKKWAYESGKVACRTPWFCETQFEHLCVRKVKSLHL